MTQVERKHMVKRNEVPAGHEAEEAEAEVTEEQVRR